MTIDDFIAANPQVEWHTKRRIGGHSGVLGTNAAGEKVWVIILGNHNIACTAPMTRANIRTAVDCVEDIQPGVEFKTRGGDHHAAIMRDAGFKVIRGDDGHPMGLKRKVA